MMGMKLIILSGAQKTLLGMIRHGDWRALYQIDNGVMTVTITQVGNRREVYR